ncbi:unnamed protein product, partial [Timema podura]|nr:unnamed protein product [Timema podura]
DQNSSLDLPVIGSPIYCSKIDALRLFNQQSRCGTNVTDIEEIALVIKKVESAEKNPKAIDRWIKDISDLHRSKPPPTVHYTRSMPDIDGLMQEWPSDLEQQLREVGLPTDDLDCDLPSFVDIVCSESATYSSADSLFDIPTYESRIQSLHVLFTLYSAVKTSQHTTGT